MNDAAMRLYAPQGSAQPYGEEWWERDRLTIAAKNGREFQHLMHACLRAAPNWAQVERLRRDNMAQIEQLDRATREDVLAMLVAREKELRGNA
jgi:hypothetical protein